MYTTNLGGQPLALYAHFNDFDLLSIVKTNTCVPPASCMLIPYASVYMSRQDQVTQTCHRQLHVHEYYEYIHCERICYMSLLVATTHRGLTDRVLFQRLC